LRCDRCGTLVAPIASKESPVVERLTARQVREYFPEAAGDVEIHEAVCGWEEGGGGPWAQSPREAR
jgi:hypothetical protein